MRPRRQSGTRRDQVNSKERDSARRILKQGRPRVGRLAMAIDTSLDPAVTVPFGNCGGNWNGALAPDRFQADL